MTKSIAAIAAVIASAPSAWSQVVINEVMQSNIDCLYADHEYPDSWIELYNPGLSTVNIGGWRVGVKEKLSKCYTLPSATVPPHGYLVIYCDKSDAGGLHTDFRLESGKDGSIYLYDADGRLVDSLTGMKKMPAPNVAYGRTADGGTSWAYMVSATPGSSNTGTTGTVISASAVHPEPLFSRDAAVGVVGDAIDVTVSKPADATATARLCVTTDGREPTIADAVDADTWSSTITTSTVVRARLLSDDMLPRRSTTRSYIILDAPTALRVVSIVGDPDDFYDSGRGIFSGANFSYTMTDRDIALSNWNYKWRRPVNVEYFAGGDTHIPGFNQLGETRVHGGITRRYPQKSLTVYANKRFGTKRYDTADFWPEKPEVTESKSFVIRNGGNMFLSTRINDALAQSLIGLGNPAIDYQAYAPCIYYLNGRYMGIGDLRERSSEDFIAANYTDAAGDELEDIDMIENWDEVKAGSLDPLEALQQWYNTPDITYADLCDRIDIDNFIDQLVVQWVGGNRDFFDNNIVCWAPAVDGIKSRACPDDVYPKGRWRWVIKDLDQFANTLNLDVSQSGDYYDYAEAFYALKPERHRLFRLVYQELLEARERFIDRMMVCLGDRLSPAAIAEMVERVTTEIYDEYPRHLAHYFNDEDAAMYMDDSWIGGFPAGTRYIARDWAVSRQTNVYDQLKRHYGVGNNVYMKIYRGDDNAEATLNGFPLTRDIFDGLWFTNREIRLSTDNIHSIQVYRNGVFIADRGNSLSMMPGDANSLDFYIVPATGDSGIDTIEADAPGDVRYFTPDGLPVANPTAPGLYIIVSPGHPATKIRL